MSTLIPNYISIDFNTMITRLKNNLQNSDIFADYNFEGSNISILMELNAYIAELQTFFLNKIAKNIHIETADVYECVNRVSRQMGYEPRGYRSSRTTLTITASGASIVVGDQIRISEFTQFEAPNSLYDGETIKFANTTQFSGTVSASQVFFSLPVRQGDIEEITGYTGADLVDNELILPTIYAYDDDIEDLYPSIQVLINGDPWTRITDFYDEISPLANVDNVYMFVYDRYERNKIVFNTSRNVPGDDDTIIITVLQSFGSNGDVAGNEITQSEGNERYLYNVTRNIWVPITDMSITNSTASEGGAEPETIDTIKENAKAGLHAQFRNVTAFDYKSHLEARNGIVAAAAWGEQEIAPSGSILEYNKVHLSTIPSSWGSGTISTSTSAWSTTWSTSASVLIPTVYNSEWKNILSTYLEPRKAITAYEIFEIPDLIYFTFDWGIRTKRLYDFDDVQNDIKNKLIWYFRAINQNFNSEINFNNIIEYILDTTESSDTDNFTYIQGIRNLNLRDIEVSATVYEYNTSGNYPYYVETAATYIGENQLRKIQLGLNQFPILASESIRIREEI